MTRTYILPNGELKDAKKYSAIVDYNAQKPIDVLSKFSNLDSLLRGVTFTSLFDRKIIESYNIRFNPSISLCEDTVFKYDFLSHCNSLVCTPCMGYHYVYSPTSLANKKRSCEEKLYVYRTLFMRERELLKEFKKNRKFDFFSKRFFFVGSMYNIVSSQELNFYKKLKETKNVLSYFCGVFSYVASPFILVGLIIYKKRHFLVKK